MTPDKALLGGVLNGYGDIDALTEIIFPTDFAEPRDEMVWAAILRVHEAGSRVDPLTVRPAIGEDGWKLLKDHGGPLYLHELMQACPNPAATRDYAEQVADAAGRRRLSSAVWAIDHDVRESNRPFHEVAETARTRIDRATLYASTHQPVRIGDVIAEVVDIAEKGTTKGLSTPWPDLDRFTRGLAPGRLIVVGARPGVGKSVMGTNLALDVAFRHGHEVLLCSLEMPRQEVTQRVLAAHAHLDLSQLESGGVPPQTWEAVAEKVSQAHDFPITIEDASTQTLGSIRVALRRAIKAAGRQDRKVALLVVDYLQLLTARDHRVNRTEQVAEMSRGLKQLAREYGVCVVAMAQVNRAATQRRDGRPTLSDLRESGAIEADADVVILLHRPDEESPEIEALVAKNRSGPRGEARLQMQGHYARLVPAAGWRAS